MSSDPRIPIVRSGSVPDAPATGFQQQLERAWRQTAMTAMFNALAHELNQPLTAITLHCDAALTAARAAPDTEPEIMVEIEQAAAGAYRAGDIVALLRRGMPRPDPPSSAVQLNRLVEAALQLAEADLRDNTVSIECRLDPQLPELALNEPQIVHLILNLLRCSIACRTDERLPPEITISTQSDESVIEMRISCAGTVPGIEFERFGLLDAIRSAETGLDAAICRIIVEAHSGRLWIERNGELQTVIIVSLPLETG